MLLLLLLLLKVTLLPRMIFTGRSVDALDEMRGTGTTNGQPDGHRNMSAVAIAAGWFSSLRRPGRKHKKNYQKQAKSVWDLSALATTVSRDDEEIASFAFDNERCCNERRLPAVFFFFPLTEITIDSQIVNDRNFSRPE